MVRRVYYDNPEDQAAVRHRLLKAMEDDTSRINKDLTDAYVKQGWAGKVREYAKSQYDNKATQYTPYSGAPNTQFEGISETLSWGYERVPSSVGGE
jgi:hypothetical protein